MGQGRGWGGEGGRLASDWAGVALMQFELDFLDEHGHVLWEHISCNTVACETRD